MHIPFGSAMIAFVFSRIEWAIARVPPTPLLWVWAWRAQRSKAAADLFQTSIYIYIYPDLQTNIILIVVFGTNIIHNPFPERAKRWRIFQGPPITVGKF